DDKKTVHEGGPGESVAALPSSSTGVIVPFKRRFVAPGIALALLEILGIGWPLWSTFDLGDLGADTLIRTVLPVAVGGITVWIVAVATWFAPLYQAVAARRRGERVPKELAARAYRITLKGPVRALLLRTMVWTTGAALIGLFLYVYDAWPVDRIAAMIALAAVHSYVVSCVRAVWLASILGDLRKRMFAVGSPLKKFDDSHFRRFVLVSMIVAGGVLAAQAAFASYFVRITRLQYLQLETYFPIATLLGLVAWVWLARW